MISNILEKYEDKPIVLFINCFLFHFCIEAIFCAIIQTLRKSLSSGLRTAYFPSLILIQQEALNKFTSCQLTCYWRDTCFHLSFMEFWKETIKWKTKSPKKRINGLLETIKRLPYDVVRQHIDLKYTLIPLDQFQFWYTTHLLSMSWI